jgi:hypothetical protein
MISLPELRSRRWWRTAPSPHSTRRRRLRQGCRGAAGRVSGRPNPAGHIDARRDCPFVIRDGGNTPVASAMTIAASARPSPNKPAVHGMPTATETLVPGDLMSMDCGQSPTDGMVESAAWNGVSRRPGRAPRLVYGSPMQSRKYRHPSHLRGPSTQSGRCGRRRNARRPPPGANRTLHPRGGVSHGSTE